MPSGIEAYISLKNKIMISLLALLTARLNLIKTKFFAFYLLLPSYKGRSPAERKSVQNKSFYDEFMNYD